MPEEAQARNLAANSPVANKSQPFSADLTALPSSVTLGDGCILSSVFQSRYTEGNNVLVADDRFNDDETTSGIRGYSANRQFTAPHFVFNNGYEYAAEERGYDYNMDGNKRGGLLPYDEYINGANRHHPDTLPGKANKDFHQKPGQDDWRGPTFGTNYYSLYGIIDGESTTVRQIFRFDIRKIIRQLPDSRMIHETLLGMDLEPVKGRGDGTVPDMSLRRKSLDESISFLPAPPPGRELRTMGLNKVDHIGIVKSPLTWKFICMFLKGQEIYKDKEVPVPPECRFEGGGDMAQAMPEEPENNPVPHHYVSFSNVGSLQVADGYGNRASILGESLFDHVPGLIVDRTSPNSALLTLRTDQTYTITFANHPSGAANVEALKGVGNREPTQAVRYNDLLLPAGATAMLRVTPGGAEPMRYDLNGSGAFNTVVQPTASLSGQTAKDVDGPVVGFSENAQGATAEVTLTASDPAGVDSAYYSLDALSPKMSFLLYTGPVQLDPSRTPVVYAFADDGVGNRSSLFEYRVQSGTKITFASDRDGNSEIYVMNADGGAQTRRTVSPSTDTSPAWSPVGRKIAFTSDRDGNSEVYVMDADGSGLVNLTNAAGDDTHPAWSPDGTKLAFVSSRSGGRQVYVMNADGSG